MKFCSECQRCYEDADLACTEKGHEVLSDLRAGSCEMIAGYRLEVLLASGTSSEVFRARRTDCGQHCRIRIVAADADHGQQFLREAKQAASLFHPNLADIYEAGSLGDAEVFVIGEETGCRTVRDLLNAVGVPQLLTSIQIIRQAAEALHELHLKGLIHRAIRPENIVLSNDAGHGLVVRIQDPDFGGAVERSIVSNKFLIDTAIDALRYFAPEQVTGDAVSIKTDVYGLGIVFYEMLAGVPPFDDVKAAGVIEKHKNQRPPEIKIDDFELRMLVTHALTEALQKRPDKRQSSANALARQLRHIEQLATHVSTPPPAVAVKARPSAPAAQAEAGPTMAVVSSPASVALAESAAEAIVDAQTAIDLQMLIPALDVPAEPVVLEGPTEDLLHAARRSRLKLHRKRTHAKPQEMVIPSKPASIEPILTGDQPVKIEWEQPDDDIPSIEDAADVLRREVIDEAMPAAEVRAAKSVRKVKWDQPEEDIPSLEDVAAALSRQADNAFAQEICFRQELPKVEWELPENDIPTMEDVAAVPAREPAVVRSITAEAIAAEAIDEGLIVPPQSTAMKEMPVGRSRQTSPAAASGLAKRRLKPQDKRVASAPIEDDEEITQVRAPSRIRVDWDTPRLRPARFSPVIPSDVDFFPTLLGSVANPPDRTDSIFAAYGDESSAGRSRSYRALVIAGGLVGLIALYFVTSDPVGRLTRGWSAHDPVTAKSDAAKDAAPPSQPSSRINTASVPAPAKADMQVVEKPVSDDVVSDIVRTDTVAIKARAVVADEKPQAEVVRSVERKSPPPASTLVISSENGRVVTHTEASAGATRPRIVKDPRP